MFKQVLFDDFYLMLLASLLLPSKNLIYYFTIFVFASLKIILRFSQKEQFLIHQMFEKLLHKFTIMKSLLQSLDLKFLNFYVTQNRIHLLLKSCSFSFHKIAQAQKTGYTHCRPSMNRLNGLDVKMNKTSSMCSIFII